MTIRKAVPIEQPEYVEFIFRSGEPDIDNEIKNWLVDTAPGWGYTHITEVQPSRATGAAARYRQVRNVLKINLEEGEKELLIGMALVYDSHKFSILTGRQFAQKYKIVKE